MSAKQNSLHCHGPPSLKHLKYRMFFVRWKGLCHIHVMILIVINIFSNDAYINMAIRVISLFSE